MIYSLYSIKLNMSNCYNLCMNNIELIKLGQKIAFERKKRGLSQEQLAELSDISIHGISNIENGKTNIKYTNLLLIASAFKMRICELLDFNL